MNTSQGQIAQPLDRVHLLELENGGRGQLDTVGLKMATYTATYVDPRWWKTEYIAKGNLGGSVILSVPVG